MLAQFPNVKLPLWCSPWREGVQDGRGFIACTIAHSRSERNTEGRSLDVVVFDEELTGLNEAERKHHILVSLVEAIKHLGIDVRKTPVEPVRSA